MRDYSGQKEEIKTIQERTIKVSLSDADCIRITNLCGEHGLTVGKLIKNFIGDLVDGTYSNGSDERMYAKQWFKRCYFGMFPEPTLLRHLLYNGYEPEDYMNYLGYIETAKEEIKYLEEHPEEAEDGEIENLNEEIEHWQEELEYMRDGWTEKDDHSMEEELLVIKSWLKDKWSLIEQSDG